MSLDSMCFTAVNIYSVITSQDAYAANNERYTLKYSGIRARIMYLTGAGYWMNGYLDELRLWRGVDITPYIGSIYTNSKSKFGR